MFKVPILVLATLFTTLLAIPIIPPSELVERQNTGCYCGVLTGDSCGSRTSSGLSLSGSCSANIVYTCDSQFGNAQVKTRCLICNASGQDGYDTCLLGLGIRSNGTINL